MQNMAAHKFKPGDRITNGIVEKTVIAWNGNHYLTDCGRVDYENENNWHKVKNHD